MSIPKLSAKLKLLILVVVVIIIAAIAAGSNGGPVNHAVSNAAPDKSITASALASDPSKYKGKVVEITGKVFNIESKNNQIAIQIWANPEKSEGNIIVYYKGTESYHNDDYIKVVGEVGSTYSGQNAFGGNVSAATVTARSITKVSRDEAVAPALKVITPNKIQTLEGMSLTIQKIEFASTETRVYVQIKNTSSSTVNFYSFDLKMVQSGSQINQKTLFDASNDDIPSDIVSKTIESGKIYFEKADQNKPLQITYKGFSNATNKDLNYSFTISP